ncbi:putative RNA polymerase I-specific transcription initiation factor rrn3 [Cercophora samala]|uniref:RNA polymerase I-specific transcription initiation factor rrn3 n=1 Tax=Cercophora samala TaxID=330535 RepID=A0AA39ZGB6_9PEZI|nr:putative RNA polymerase I-specific transcription initiation factor rrn3 [Cercophora samala]
MTTNTPLSRLAFAPTVASSPIKPILRKTTSVLGTRSRADDSDGADEEEHPMKRQKKTVVFNEKLNMIREISGKSLEDAKREVRQALEGHARGDDEDYDNLKELFAPSNRNRSPDADEDDTRPQELLVYVVALTGYVPMLGRSCAGLIRSVLRCSWLDRDENFTKAYIQLLAALSSVQASFFEQVLTMVVEKFRETKSYSLVPGFPPVDLETKKRWLHVGIKYLLDLFPAGSNMILNFVASKFPHTTESKAVHMSYIDHLLRLKASRSDLERDIMELILEKLVKLDVEMTLDLENDEDDTTRAVMRSIQVAGDKDDQEDDESDDESVMSDDDDDLPEETKRVIMIKRKLETLDAIMDLVFSIYDPIFEKPDSEEAVECFKDLLSDFKNVILPHLKSRHTQYLLFKFAMKSDQLMELFLGMLLTIAFHSTDAPVIKQAAAAYLASFTARGARVQSHNVQLIVGCLLNYIDYYRETHKNCRGPDVRRYSLYYASFQGLLYIFCFRWRDLLDQDALPESVDWDDPVSFLGKELPWMPDLKRRMQANIASKLNPLKCCSPVIVEEFAQLAHHLRLMYIYPQIEKNKSIHLSQFFTGSYAQGGALRDTGFEFDNEKWTHLEACFPFDPFQLPIARRWLDLENNYVTWSPISVLRKPGEEDSDEDDEEEDSDEEEGSEEESEMGEEELEDREGLFEEDTATDDERAD